MATYSAKDVAFLLVDGASILPRTGSITSKVTATMDDVTPLGVEYSEAAYGGLKTGEFTHAGFYDDATNSTNDAFNEQNGVSRVVCAGLEGNTIGKALTGMGGAYQSAYERVATKGQIHRANGSFTVSGDVDEGVILHALGAETAAGDTQDDSVDNGASSANGGAGYLQVSALTLGGYTNVAVKIQGSADDTTYTDLVSFTAVTAAPDAERKTVTGTVKQYLAASWSFTGSGSSPSATFMVGFARS